MLPRLNEKSMSRMGKAIVIIACFFPLFLYAATLAELQAQLTALQQKVSALISLQGTTAAPPTSTSSGQASGAAACPNLSRNLSRRSRGADVTQLQLFLISQNLLASDSATGFFGLFTERAVQQWQSKNGIVSSGTPSTTGYGAVGPKTRNRIAMSCKGPSSAIPNIKPTPVPIVPTVPPVYEGGGGGSGESSPLPIPVCTPKQPQTQTLSCPTGQTGIITQTRTSLCATGATSPTWGEWQTTTITCVVPQKTVISGALDPIDWMTTNKGTGHVRGYFETWNSSNGTWVSGTGGVSQPFKMFTNTATSQIYWRKDMPAETQRGDGKDYEFSGEIYTFDASSVRLRSESMYFFPCPAIGARCDPAGQAWDIRADKFRLFVDGTGPLGTTEGLFFMPRPVWHGWSHGPYPLTTYYCASYTEFHQSTCSLYQKSDQWGWVTVEAYHNYDIFNADGDQVVATPDGDPQQRIFDVLIVSQEQQVTNFSESVPAGTARGVARERFFYGKIKNDRYGFIRWDSAKNVNGRYVLDARTVGYAWDTSYNPQFSEMQARGAEDRQ